MHTIALREGSRERFGGGLLGDVSASSREGEQRSVHPIALRAEERVEVTLPIGFDVDAGQFILHRRHHRPLMTDGGDGPGVYLPFGRGG
jgi:hypothetical protein